MPLSRPSTKFFPFFLAGFLGLGFSACGGETSSDDDNNGKPKLNPDGRNVDGYGDGTKKYTNGSFAGCTNPAPLIEGRDTGYFRCQEAILWRPEILECPNTLPQNNVVEFPDVVLMNAGGAAGESNYQIVLDECASNADCGENDHCWVGQLNANGECISPGEWPQEWGRKCIPGCTVDADCAENQLCRCGAEIGSCSPVSPVHGCRSDADCGSGYHCLSNLWGSFACQLPLDACHSNEGCDWGEHCTFDYEVDARVCEIFHEGC